MRREVALKKSIKEIMGVICCLRIMASFTVLDVMQCFLGWVCLRIFQYNIVIGYLGIMVITKSIYCIFYINKSVYCCYSNLYIWLLVKPILCCLLVCICRMIMFIYLTGKALILGLRIWVMKEIQCQIALGHIKRNCLNILLDLV